MAAAQISLVAEGRAQEIAGTVRVTASEIVATCLLPEPAFWLAVHQELRTSARVRRVFDFLVQHLPPVPG